jgi:hypothetical protein
MQFKKLHGIMSVEHATSGLGTRRCRSMRFENIFDFALPPSPETPSAPKLRNQGREAHIALLIDLCTMADVQGAVVTIANLPSRSAFDSFWPSRRDMR